MRTAPDHARGRTEELSHFPENLYGKVVVMGDATVRRLGPGDEDAERKLAEREPQVGLLADEATIFLAAFQGNEPIGFVFGYELPRRHGAPALLFIYESLGGQRSDTVMWDYRYADS